MYVGRRQGSPWREIWRLPLPAGARLIFNQGPKPGGPAWRVSTDKRFLILDTPIPGICDFESQGTWEAHYLIPGETSLVQILPIPLPMNAEEVVAACLSSAMKLWSPQLPLTDRIPDPFTGEQRAFEVSFTREPLPAGRDVRLGLATDVAGLGRVSWSGVTWVVGFAVTLLVAAILGVGLAAVRCSRDRGSSAAGREGEAAEGEA
jgi:hypothetical protein